MNFKISNLLFAAQVTIGRRRQLQRAEADIIQSLPGFLKIPRPFAKRVQTIRKSVVFEVIAAVQKHVTLTDLEHSAE